METALIWSGESLPVGHVSKREPAKTREAGFLGVPASRDNPVITSRRDGLKRGELRATYCVEKKPSGIQGNELKRILAGSSPVSRSKLTP
jgi:hypothetical protein